MKYYLKKHQSTLKINTLIELTFVILSIINVGLLWQFHQIPMRSLDFAFHWQRVNELIQNSTIFPQFATNMFSGNGSAVMTMYPYLFLYPAAFLLIHFHSVVTCSLIMLVINTFLASSISYFSSLGLSHSKLTSFIFALTYSITTYFTAMNTTFFYNDELYASIFMPLVIFGFIYYLKDNRWIMLSVGMTLIIYSSVIISAITPILLLGWLISNYQSLSKSKFINIIKAIGATLITSAAFIIPAIKLMLLNRIKHPMAHHIITVKLSHVIMIPFESLFSPHSSLTIYSIIGLIIGLILFKRLSPLMKQACIFSGIIVLLGSDLFPWWLLDNTFINVIQHTSRIFLLPQVILTYILAIFIQAQIQHRSILRTGISLSSLILIIFAIQFGNQTLMYDKYYHNVKAPLATNQIINITNYQFLIHHNSSYDYYPQNALKHKKLILMDQGIINKHHQHQKIQFVPLGNGEFKFHNQLSATKIVLPFLYYHGNNYRCYLDSKLIKSFHNQRQLITIHHIKSGNHLIKIWIPISKAVIISRLITVMGLLIYGNLGYSYYKRRS